MVQRKISAVSHFCGMVPEWKSHVERVNAIETQMVSEIFTPAMLKHLEMIAKMYRSWLAKL